MGELWFGRLDLSARTPLRTCLGREHFEPGGASGGDGEDEKTRKKKKGGSWGEVPEMQSEEGTG